MDWKNLLGNNYEIAVTLLKKYDGALGEGLCRTVGAVGKGNGTPGGTPPREGPGVL